MAQQYLRRAKIEVDGQSTWEYDGRVPDTIADRQGGGPGLRLRFDVHQKDKSTPNYANIYVTNPAPSKTVPAFYENKRVKLWAGYSDLGLLFDGQMRQARIMSDELPDRVLHLLATDMSTPRNYAVVSASLPAGHTLKDRADLAIKAFEKMGVGTGYVAPLAPDIKFLRSFAFSGPAHELMRQVCQAGKASWSIQNGTQQIVANDTPKPGSAIVLNRNTGLVGYAQQTMQGIEGVCLLNPRIVPTCVVQINDSAIQQAAIDPSIPATAQNGLLGKIDADGFYKIYYVSHDGDTRGPNFYTRFIGVSLRQGHISIAMASRGITPGYPRQ